jgi:hypothetical protein
MIEFDEPAITSTSQADVSPRMGVKRKIEDPRTERAAVMARLPCNANIHWLAA